jgi:hypothetical protein
MNKKEPAVTNSETAMTIQRAPVPSASGRSPDIRPCLHKRLPASGQQSRPGAGDYRARAD